MDKHIYSREEAEKVLTSFPQSCVDALVELALRIENDPARINDADTKKTLTLPEGWDYQVFANCVIARYMEDEQQRKETFVPQVWVHYTRYVNEDRPRVEKSVVDFPALGFCTCGRRMPLVQWLLRADDLLKEGGLQNLPSRLLGRAIVLGVSLWMYVRPIHQYSLMYNRHPDCL